MMKKLCVIFLALLLSVQMTAMAEGEITGTVYGNGTVTVEKGSDGVTFTFFPGAANEVKSFTVNGAEVTVTDNQATVAQANTYEVVFEGKAQSLTRETPKVLMENGVVTSVGGVNNNAQDSENKLIIRKTAGTGTDPAVSQYGYDLTRVNSRSDTMHLWREAGDGALCKVAIGRTYRPNVYFKNTHTDKNVDIQIEQLTVDTGYLHTNTSRQVLINNSWAPLQINKINARMPAGQDSVCYKGKDALTITSVYDKDGAGEIQTEDSDWLIMRRLIFVKPGIDNYSGDIGGKIYLQGVSFDETTSYHTVTADIGEGSMRFSSESLNFGTDNNNVSVKNGVALAVEDNRPATFIVTAPEGKAVEKVEWNGTALTAADGVYTIPYVSENGTVAVTYQDVIVIPEEYSETIDFSNDAYAKETLVSTLTPYQNGTVTFTFFDNGVTGGLVAFKDGDNHLREYVKFYADGTYQFNALDGTQELGDKETTRPRSTGSHTIKITTSGTSYSVYLDDALVHSVKLSESSIGVKQVYVQKKSGAKYEIEGTPRTLYYQPITAAENQPAVAATSVIANATYENQPAAVVYVKITGTAKGAGIFLKNEEGNELALNAYNVDNTLLTSGAFGIRVFGDAMKVGSKYQFIPFVTYDNGADEVTERSDGDSFTLTAAE